MIQIFKLLTLLTLLSFYLPAISQAAKFKITDHAEHNKLRNRLLRKKTLYKASSKLPSFTFDIPVEYNDRVRFWVRYFQTKGRNWFSRCLSRSTRYIPTIHTILRREGLPLDLAYVALVESGFSDYAESHASAVGMWQFIPSTGLSYGLKINWWIDERRDFIKATEAAIQYKKKLYSMFNSWPLVMASYNAGENRVKRLVKKHKTNNFWILANLKSLPQETIDYLPKIMAATIIAKNPKLYGFREVKYKSPELYEYVKIPGGTHLKKVAKLTSENYKTIRNLNPELLKFYIPKEILSHKIRVPLGRGTLVRHHFAKVNKKISLNKSDPTKTPYY